MSIACHAQRWWKFCTSEDEEKEIKRVFTEKCF